MLRLLVLGTQSEKQSCRGKSRDPDRSCGSNTNECRKRPATRLFNDVSTPALRRGFFLTQELVAWGLRQMALKFQLPQFRILAPNSVPGDGDSNSTYFVELL